MLVTKFGTKKILSDTLREMKIGDSVTIRNRDFKPSAIRSAAYRLKKNHDIILAVSDKDRIDDTLITRIS